MNSLHPPPPHFDIPPRNPPMPPFQHQQHLPVIHARYSYQLTNSALARTHARTHVSAKTCRQEPEESPRSRNSPKVSSPTRIHLADRVSELFKSRKEQTPSSLLVSSRFRQVSRPSSISTRNSVPEIRSSHLTWSCPQRHCHGWRRTIYLFIGCVYEACEGALDVFLSPRHQYM